MHVLDVKATEIYETDLSDLQWVLIQEFFLSEKKSKGRPIGVDLRAVFNAVLYICKTGCQYYMLPKTYPSKSTVHRYHQKWSSNGLLERILNRLNEIDRIINNEDEGPKIGIIDSQSAITTGAAKEKGYDGGKKRKGRKRHIGVDRSGRLLELEVHKANEYDGNAGVEILRRMNTHYPSINTYYADRGYRGKAKDYVELICQKTMIIPEKPKNGFVVERIRWIVERTFAWLNHSRRLSKDFEIKKENEAGFFRMSMIAIMLNKVCFGIRVKACNMTNY